MQEVKGNIWDYYDKGNWIVIPTNGTIKKNGEAVMGRGLALQAKLRFPDLPAKIGKGLKTYANFYGEGKGNRVQYYQPIRILTFPVKYNWQERADLGLIEESCKQLVANFQMFGSSLYLPRVGCGNGRLDWENVKPILERYLGDGFIIVSL